MKNWAIYAAALLLTAAAAGGASYFVHGGGPQLASDAAPAEAGTVYNVLILRADGTLDAYPFPSKPDLIQRDGNRLLVSGFANGVFYDFFPITLGEGDRFIRVDPPELTKIPLPGAPTPAVEPVPVDLQGLPPPPPPDVPSCGVTVGPNGPRPCPVGPQ